MRRTIIAALAMAWMCQTSWAQIIVGPGESIQVAINTAPPNTQIQVLPGTYNESIDFLGFDLDLVAVGPGETIINGDHQNFVVRITGGQTSAAKIRGFIIQHPDEYHFGGGILCENSSPTITDNVIRNNRSGGGSGIYMTNSQPVISDNDISGNSAYFSIGSLQGIGGAVYMESSSPTLTGNSIDSNYSDGLGGAIYSLTSSPVITDNTFTNNYGNSGGGVCYMRGASTPSLIENFFVENWTGAGSPSLGAGLFIEAGCMALVERNEFTSNNAAGDGSGGVGDAGGAIYCRDLTGSTPCRIRLNVFRQNFAGGNGGAIMVRSSTNVVIELNQILENLASKGGGGISIRGNSSVLVSQNEIAFNTSSMTGGGIRVDNSSVDLVGNEIIENVAGTSGGGVAWVGSTAVAAKMNKNLVKDNEALVRGAGIYLDNAGNLLMTNNMVVENVLTPASGANPGAGIFCRNTPALIVNNTVAYNVTGPSADADGGGVAVAGTTIPVLYNCIVWGNTSAKQIDGVSTSDPQAVHCCVGPISYPGQGNIHEEPWPLGAPTDGDYHLDAGSECIGAAHASAPGLPPDDFDGQLRTGTIDIGADEYSQFGPP